MYQQPILKKPPSRRNRDIFTAVRVDLNSFREVAKQFKLSTGRVSAIVKQVERWIGETGASPHGTTWQERLFVMEEIHRQRLDKLFQQALVGWERSQQDIQTNKLTQIDGKPDKRELITKTTSGDRRFLESALKIEEARLKFEEHSEQIQPEPRELENAPPAVKEVDPYWRPWPQTEEEIAKRRAKIEAFVREEGIMDFNGTHIDVARMEMLIADKENAARAAAVAAKAAEETEDRDVGVRTNCDSPFPTPIQPSFASPVSLIKKPTIHLMTVTPIVPSANRKRALIHPNDRPKRPALPGWEW
jgi:hypothetical protein